MTISVYHSPLKRGGRSAHTAPWCATVMDGSFVTTERFATEEEARERATELAYDRAGVKL